MIVADIDSRWSGCVFQIHKLLQILNLRWNYKV